MNDHMASFVSALATRTPRGVEGFSAAIAAGPGNDRMSWDAILFQTVDESIWGLKGPRYRESSLWTALPRAATTWIIDPPNQYRLSSAVRPDEDDPLFKIALGIGRGSVGNADYDIWSGFISFEPSDDWPRYSDIIAAIEALGYKTENGLWRLLEHNNCIMPVGWLPKQVIAIDACGLRLKDLRTSTVGDLYFRKWTQDDYVEAAKQEGWDGVFVRGFTGQSGIDGTWFEIFPEAIADRYQITIPCTHSTWASWTDTQYGPTGPAIRWTEGVDNRHGQMMEIEPWVPWHKADDCGTSDLD
jgi:hypothetical protein